MSKFLSLLISPSLIGLWLLHGHDAWYYMWAIWQSLSFALVLFGLGVVGMMDLMDRPWRTHGHRVKFTRTRPTLAVGVILQISIFVVLILHEKEFMATILFLTVACGLILRFWSLLPPHDPHPNRLDKETHYHDI